jgi:hypothetical protein
MDDVTFQDVTLQTGPYWNEALPDGGSSIISILPYRLRALRRRERAAWAAESALASLPLRPEPTSPARLRHGEPGPIRAGIRHIASGRMTVIQAGMKTAMAILAERTARRHGLLEDERLEAVVIDRMRQVFAGFWPQ